MPANAKVLNRLCHCLLKKVIPDGLQCAVLSFAVTGGFSNYKLHITMMLQ